MPGIPQIYGDKQIFINTKKLQKDINAGKVEGTSIVTHKQLIEPMQKKVSELQGLYDSKPSNTLKKKLDAAKVQLKNATRDNECLIVGCVPKKYIK